MSGAHYPSVTIVAGELEPPRGPSVTSGHMLRMHDGATYIHILPEIARQWIETLTPIASEGNK